MDKLVEEIIKGLFTLPCNLTPNQILIIERVAERLKNHTTFNQMQASRPDRLGDECWFRIGGLWSRGILRHWSMEVGAAIEDAESKRIWFATEISFSTEAPQ
jgi:hypothetical protein